MTTTMTTPLPTLSGKVIQPLIVQHAQDAAFYWLQIDQAWMLPHISTERLRYFRGLLEANLEGLQIAQAVGEQCALAALKTWKQPGEMFVATHLAALALAQGRPELMAQVEAVLIEETDSVMRGAISALALLPEQARDGLIDRWNHADTDPVLLVVMLRGMALFAQATELAPDQRPHPVAESFHHYMAHASAHVRAAAARSARSVLPPSICARVLRDLIQDADLTVRAEAAIGLKWLVARTTHEDDRVTEVLLSCVQDQAAALSKTTGWFRLTAERRLTRWLKHVARILPLNHESANGLLQTLPTKLALVFCVHHGHPAHVPWVVDAACATGDQAWPRYAMWAWELMTGIDPHEAGLTLPEPDDEEGLNTMPMSPSAARDQGRALPNAEALRAYAWQWKEPLSAEDRVLGGRAQRVENLVVLRQTARMDVRFVAAHAWGWSQRPAGSLHAGWWAAALTPN